MSEHRCEFEAFEPDEGRCNAPATKFIETGGGTDWKVIWVCDRHHADLAGRRRQVLIPEENSD